MIGKTKDIQKFRHGTIRNIEDHLKQSNGISFWEMGGTVEKFQDE